MRLSKKSLAGTLSAAALLCAPPAFAQTSAQQGYSVPGGIVETQIDNSGDGGDPGAVISTTERITPSTSSASTSSGQQLPFTGLDLALVVATGGVLMGLGLGMRRLSRSTRLT